MQFERAEFAGASATCAFCKQPVRDAYYQVGDQVACERCKTEFEVSQMETGSGLARFLRAGVFGLAAALLGGAIWYGVRAVTGYELGLIAVVVGLMVGGAVRAGSRRRGGPLYQALAVALTYFGICAQYVPDVWKALSDGVQQEGAAATGQPAPADAPMTTPAPDAVVAAAAAPAAAPAPAKPDDSGPPNLLQLGVVLALVLAFAMAAPFLGGFQNAIGILIIGFALWEAWKMNQRVPIEVSGPFRVKAPEAAQAPRPPAE